MFMGFGITGWTLINFFNCERRWYPFTDGNFSHASFKKMLVLTPILFLFAGTIVFRQKEDLSGYCSESDHVRKTIQLRATLDDSLTTTQTVLETEDDTLLLLHTIQLGDYMGEQRDAANVSCHEYTDLEVYNWNFYFWVTSFLLLGC